MVLERSYSSASSTTSSRRSGRRKRKRIKHTVMPLKKRPGRHEVPCDVHRVSNLDHEEMVQSACFWVAKNPVDEPERSFKEEVFVNKDEEEFSDEDASCSTEEARQSRHTEESGSRADSHALEGRHYTEEKTFYGLRKGKMSDGGDVERISPRPSSRNDSRLSSVSDDSQSGASSDGHGMLVGWTSDINNSSGPECSGITDEESEGEKGGGGGEGIRRPRKDLRSINDKWEESIRRDEDETLLQTSSDSRSRDHRSVERRANHRQHIVVAKDVTSFESNTFETERSHHNDSLDSGSKDGDFPRTREQVPQEYRYQEHRPWEHGPHGSDSGGFYPGGEIQDSDRRDFDSRRSYRGTEVRESEYFGYNRRDVQETSTVEHSFMNGRDVYPGGKAPGGYIGEPGQDRVESPIVESSGYDSNYLTSAAGEPLSGVRTSTPTRRELPSSDTEVVLQNYDADGEQSSNRSLPVGHRKTTTKYYSVVELRRSTGTSDETADRGPNVSSAPRREDGVGSRGDDFEESETPAEREMRVGRESGSVESGNTRIVATGYELNKQRPRYISRRGNEFDEDNKENVGPNETNGEGKEPRGTLSEREHLNREKWEEEMEFHGYRRHQADDKFLKSQVVHSYSKPITRDQNREDLESSEGQRGFTRDPNDREPGDGKRSGDDTRNNFDDSNDSGRFRTGDIYPAREAPEDSEYHVANGRDVYPGGKIRGGQGEGIVRAEEEFIEREDQTETLTPRHEHTTSTEGRWEETKEFHGYRRHQTDNENSRLASIDSYGKSSTRAQWTSAEVGRGDGRQRFEKSAEEPSFAQGEREGPIAGGQQGYSAGNNLDDMHDTGPYVPRTYEDIYPGTELGDSEQFVPVSDGGVYLGGNGPAGYGGADRRPAEEDRAREEQPESPG